MSKLPNKGKAKFKKGVAFTEDGTTGGKNIPTLRKALAIDSECGCGIDCECDGLLSLPVRDTTTGEIVAYVGVYYTSADGGTTITRVEEEISVARANIKALRAL